MTTPKRNRAERVPKSVWVCLWLGQPCASLKKSVPADCRYDLHTPHPAPKLAKLREAVVRAAMKFTRDMEKAANIVGGTEPNTGFIETACARLELDLRRARGKAK